MIAVAIIPIFIPTETYRNFVEKRLSRDFDVRVTMEGFRFRLIPYPGYSIRGLGFISTQEPFKGQRVLWVKKVTGSLSLGAFFGGDLSTAVNLSGAEMDIRRSDDGSNIAAMLGIDSALDDKKSSGDNLKHISIESIEVSGGKLNIYSAGEPKPRIIDNVDIVAGNLKSAGGLGVDLGMTGSVFDDREQDFSFSGQLFYDATRREFSTRGANAYLSGSRFLLDLSMNFGLTPYSFDAHLATPALATSAIEPLLELLPQNIGKKIYWQGQLATDLSMRGTSDTFEAKLQIDGTQAKFNIGKSFLKGAGLPLKIVSTFYFQGEDVAIRDASIIFGGDKFDVDGEGSREDGFPYELTSRAKGLNLSSLKLFFPVLRMFGGAQNLGLKFSVMGDLLGEKDLDLMGTFESDGMTFAGRSLSDVNGSFSMKDGMITIDAIKGGFAGGKLSGNGWMLRGNDDEYHFDLVVDRLEASEIKMIDGIITGQSSLVVSVDGRGGDVEKTVKSLELAGSLVMKSGTLKPHAAIGSLFNEETSAAVKAQSGAGFNDGWMTKLYGLDGVVKDLHAEFIFTDGNLSVEKLSWLNPLYRADIHLNVRDGGAMVGEGDILIPKSISTELIPNGIARKLLLDRSGSLLLPVRITGNTNDPELTLDLVELDEMVADDARKAELEGSPAKIIRDDKKSVVTEKKSPERVITKENPSTIKKVAGPKKNRKPVYRRKRRPIRRPSKESTVNTDDLLRVIIGN